jgi:putative phage-type endonuclease
MHDAEILPKLDQEMRLSGVGSSEVAAIVGLSPYQSAFDVFLEKTGKMPPWEGNEHTRLGKRMERPILEEYVLRSGRAVEPLFEKTFRHPDRPWQLATPDGIDVVDRYPVEAKHVGARMGKYWGEEGTDAVPMYYLVQTQWQMSTLMAQQAVVAALIGGDRFQIYPMTLEKEIEQLLLNKVGEFWHENVQKDIPPEPADTQRTREYLHQRYDVQRAPLRQANHVESDLAHAFRQAKIAAENADKYLENIKTRLRVSIGDAEGIEGVFGQITWRAPAVSTKTDWRALAEHYRETLQFIASVNERISADDAKDALEEEKDYVLAWQPPRRLVPKWSEE